MTGLSPTRLGAPVVSDAPTMRPVASVDDYAVVTILDDLNEVPLRLPRSIWDATGGPLTDKQATYMLWLVEKLGFGLGDSEVVDNNGQLFALGKFLEGLSVRQAQVLIHALRQATGTKRRRVKRPKPAVTEDLISNVLSGVRRLGRSVAVKNRRVAVSGKVVTDAGAHLTRAACHRRLAAAGNDFVKTVAGADLLIIGDSPGGNKIRDALVHRVEIRYANEVEALQ